MCDFDLRDALHSSSDGERPGPSCFDMKEVQDQTFRLEEGLDLRVSVNRKTMQSVANLVLAANRMRKCLTRRGHSYSSDELCSMILDNMVDETIVKTMTNSSTGAVFCREMLCKLCDTEQKDVIQGPLKLQAITLKGGQYDRVVKFKMSLYTNVSPGDGQTIALSIQDNLQISCSMQDGNVVLNLEKFHTNPLENISHDENMDRFLFYRRTKGLSLNTFESVKYRGWFISTSPEDQQPVEMCKVDATSRLTCFKIDL